MKKKTILWGILTAVLLLLVACEPKTVAQPTGVPKQPTPTIQSVSPTEKPVAEVTTMPIATLPGESPRPTVVITITPEPEVTIVPTVTAAVLPTTFSTPTPEPTIPPVSPTEVPEVSLTETPVPTATLTPTVTPTPTINPEPLVTKGWQKNVSMDERYAIVFPELFRDSYVVKTDRELFLGYTSKEDTEILFAICYTMKQTLEEAVEEIVLADGIICEKKEEERRVHYQFQKDGIMYCGILVENPYSGDLLGDAFGEEESITGVMEVMFSYPAERAAEYETEEYSFYVVENREE